MHPPLATAFLETDGMFSWVMGGGLTGLVTGLLVGGEWGFLLDIIAGIIGAFGGAILVGLVTNASFGFVGTFVVAVIGAMIVTATHRAFKHRKHTLV